MFLPPHVQEELEIAAYNILIKHGYKFGDGSCDVTPIESPDGEKSLLTAAHMWFEEDDEDAEDDDEYEFGPVFT